VQLSGGASQETWAFDAILDGVRDPLILRRPPPGATRSSNITLEIEAEAIKVALVAGVKAPPIRYVLSPENRMGSGYIMGRMPGETIARKILRDKQFDAVRPRLAFECGALAAHIRNVELETLNGVLEVIDGPIQLRQYFDQYLSYNWPSPVFEIAFQWLSQRLRPAQQRVLVHGDFRNGNILISPNGVEAALDWENVHIGDALEDVGLICTKSWRFGVHEKTVGGFGTLDDFLDGYRLAGGGNLDIEDIQAWTIFGSLKWGVTCMEMYRRFLIDGSVERAAIGRRVSECELDLINAIARGIW
jgi:aminoglycoside phosphotransferase (APT) family kinase protein